MTKLTRLLVKGLETDVISAKVKRNHDRTVDTCELKISPKFPLEQGDEVTYIQDIVNTDFLTAIYNFQYSARDEAGYDIDGDDGTYTADYIEDTTRSYTENIQPAIRFNADNEKVTVADNTRIDFTKQFDIVVFVRPEAFPTGAQTFFSKSNGGVGGGIEIGVTSGDPAYVEVELINTSGILTTITGSVVNIRDAKYHAIRVKRDSVGLVSVIVDGTTEGTSTKSAAADDYTATGVDMFFGKNFGAGSKHFRGAIAQVRIYSGGILTDTEWTKVRFSKRQPVTMKFRGLVQNYEDNVGYKTVYAQSINEQIINTRISKTVMDGRDEDSNNNGIDNIFLDDSGGVRMRTETIVEQILAEIDSEYIFYNASSSGTILNRYVARGTLSSIISQLFTLDNREFWITPRKVLVKESQPISTKISILEGDWDINVSGKDNTTMINDLETVGEVQIHTIIEQFNGDASTTVFNLTHTPITTKVDISSTVQDRGIDSADSSGNEYYIEYTQGATSGSQIIFFSAPASGTNNITVEYTYEESTTLYFRSSDGTSITNNGRASARIYAPGFDQGKLATLANNIITNRKNPNQRLTAVGSKLVNFVREGLEYDVVYTPKGIDSQFELKAIEWKFPEGITILHFGEHSFDYFDIMKIQGERLVGVDDSIVKSNNI